MDSGVVGVVDLTTKSVRRMKTQHNSVSSNKLVFIVSIEHVFVLQVCATVRFIPDRPSELISGGYDSTLFHFDFWQGTILSRRAFSKRHSSPIVRTHSHTTPFSSLPVAA